MFFHGRKSTFLAYCFMLIGLCFFHISFAEEVDVEVSNDKITLGEVITITFNLKNQSKNVSPDFSPLEKDFSIMGTNYRKAMSVVNGVVNIQALLQVTVEPKKTGQLIIPEINFGNVKSPKRNILVEEVGSQGNNSQDNDDVFVQAKVNTNSLYVQSQLLYTFKLFYRTQLENPRVEPPTIENAVVAQLGDDKAYQTVFNNQHYFVYEKNFVIFPQKSGKFVIPPFRFRALKLDMNANLIDDPFYVPRNKPVMLPTQSFTVDVKSIPESFQGRIWLPAKNISLTEKWSPSANQWQVGNPVIRTITIEAHGLRADQIPDLAIDNLTGVNVYTDPAHRSNKFEGNEVVGVWAQKITYIPNSKQALQIPSVKLSWWNTNTNTNALAELNPLKIDVQDKHFNSSTNINETKINSAKIDHSSVSTNVKFENQKLKISENSMVSFYLLPWFWIAVSIFVIWLGTLSYLWKIKKSQHQSITNSEKTTTIIKKPLQLSQKDFIEACEKCDVISAQKYLLSWAQTQWQDPPLNLEELRERIQSEEFKQAVEELEKALYANKDSKWDGHALVAAYKKSQKNNASFLFKKLKHKVKSNEPLSPLNP